MQSFRQAKERFDEAHFRALRQDLADRVAGRSRDLLPFAPFERYLNAYPRIEHRRTESIPLDRIVGSVGRYHDFTRTFLPRNTALKERWAFVQQRVFSMEGLPPIEVFKVGDVYFVADGNHRVSSARVNGLSDIEAVVTEYPVDPGLKPGDSLDAALSKAGRVHFLAETGLAGRVSAGDLQLTAPGGYCKLMEHVAMQRALMGEAEPARPIVLAEAANAWYAGVYLPVADEILRHSLLRSFPSRTEADLYVWIWSTLLTLHCIFGEAMDPEEGAALLELRAEFAPRARLLSRLTKRSRGDEMFPDGMLDVLG
jgi:hypothetical protein